VGQACLELTLGRPRLSRAARACAVVLGDTIVGKRLDLTSSAMSAPWQSYHSPSALQPGEGICVKANTIFRRRGER